MKSMLSHHLSISLKKFQVSRKSHKLKLPRIINILAVSIPEKELVKHSHGPVHFVHIVTYFVKASHTFCKTVLK